MTEGPVMRVPEGRFEAVIIDAITESMGEVRRFFEAVSAALLPGGELLVDADNLQSQRHLHRVLEGRPGTFEPLGSVRDPERGITRRELLEAVEAQGVVIEDCFDVPGAMQASDGFAKRLVDQGFLATAFVGATPPARHWVIGRKTRACAGSVIIGAGSAAERSQTDAAVRRFLPSDWEIVFGPSDNERESFNRGVARSQGERLWFLPAGSTPDAELFAKLRAATVTAPAVPQAAEQIAGGLAGLMAPRLTMLTAGPIRQGWRCDQVAYEDYGMQLAALGAPPVGVPGGFECPVAASPDPTELAFEARQLAERWQPVLEQPLRGERRQATNCNDAPPWEGREPTISLCMITRNEERFLEDCLRSAADAADEIVVVDTGSTDRTLEIAHSFEAIIIEQAWGDDFSAARNRGLEVATGDWILVLDADEQLETGAAQRIREIVRDSGVSGFHMVMRNVFENGKTDGVRMVRLFRRLPGARYENRIHEQVTPSLGIVAEQLGLALSSCDVVIEHAGYASEIMIEREKDARNEALFRLQLDEHPDDIYTLYKFGDFLRRLPGREDESLELLERGLNRLHELAPHEQQGIPFAAEISALCGLELARQERVAEADRVIEFALSNFLATPNLHYIAAGLCLRLNRPDEAIAHYQHCLGYAGKVLVVPIQDGITGHVAVTGMAQAWLQKGDRETALRLLEQSRAACPSYDVSALTLSKLYFEQEQYSESLEVLTEFLAGYPDSAGACQQATLILSRLGLTDQARAMGTRAVTLLEQSSLSSEAQHMRDTVAALT